VFINEIHYDNDLGDVGEAIEIAGPAGTDLTDWDIILYNGNGGGTYNTTILTQTIPNLQNGCGVVYVSYPSNGIQNGAPDGLALVDASDNVVQFLSYEGVFTATNGPAAGMASVDIGVMEPGTTPVGYTLQLSGTGSVDEDFTWAAALTNTFGSVNNNQTFTCIMAADLSINKTVSPDTAVPYQSVVTYTVVLANNGSITDTAVYVTDTLPVSTTFVSWVEQPAGATMVADELTWNGEMAPSTAVTFTFLVSHTGDYGDVVENTAVYSGTSGSGSDTATFTVESLAGDITFVYHDLEDVVQPGEGLFLAGDFNGWNTTSTPLTPDANSDVFTVTLSGLTSGTYGYKYVVYTDTIPSGPTYWDWVNTNNRSYTVAGTATVNDYRNVVIGWANLNGPLALIVDMGTATGDVYGRLYIPGVTNTPDSAGRSLMTEVGFGDTTTPANWEWFPMAFNADDGENNDEFVGVMTPTVPGVYSYTTRYDGNWGTGNPNAAWLYADATGVGPYPGGEFSLSDTGVMTVGLVTVPISVARAGVNGEVFAVEGTVTYVPGTFNTAGWALQDASGGIGVFDSTFVPSVNYGDVVQIIGTRGAFSGEEQLTSISYFGSLGAGPEVTPLVYSTSDVNAGNAEGWIVEIQGTISSLG
ncbi:MAG: hypothetical protein KC413_19485, partial [Anaerolineales bacterium]|nr:hypothetical protein [Anaerolineales bacterium]